MLSSVLAFMGVSVTETIAVPDAVEVVPDYYEDSTQPIIEPAPEISATATRAIGTSKR